MGFFEHDDSNERQAYERFENTPREHESSFCKSVPFATSFQRIINQVPNVDSVAAHELIAGAASFAAMRSYENHQAQNGKPPSFAIAKELIAGFAGAEVDKLIETKGLDEYDALRAKHEARENVSHALAQSQEFGIQRYTREPYQQSGNDNRDMEGRYGGQQQQQQGQQYGNNGDPYGGYEGQGKGYGGPAQDGYEGQWGQGGGQGQVYEQRGQSGYDSQGGSYDQQYQGRGGCSGDRGDVYSNEQGGQYGQGQGQNYTIQGQGQQYEGERRHRGHEERRENW